MVLNNHSFVHVKIRKLCAELEEITGLMLITDLNENFEELQFINKLSYIRVDYKNEVCFVLSHRITPKEITIIDDLLLYLSWLEIGYCYKKKMNEKNKKSK